MILILAVAISLAISTVIGWLGNGRGQPDSEVIVHGSYADSDEMTDTGITYSELTAHLAAEKERYGQ